MFDLKILSTEGIPAALEKAQRYRLLNEPREAASICLDILTVEPELEPALILLLLCITDQFGEHLAAGVKEAKAVLPRLSDEYDRAYYAGIILERQARAILRRGTPGSRSNAYEWFHDAMEHFQNAEDMHPPGNDDAVLRWNACARTIMSHNLEPTQHDQDLSLLE